MSIRLEFVAEVLGHRRGFAALCTQYGISEKTGYEWLIVGVGASVGAWLASEITWTQWFTGLTDLGPQFDGLLVIPAVIGGLVIGAIVEFVARAVESPMPA